MVDGIINREMMLDFFKSMVRIREFENEAIQLAMANLTRAAIHLSLIHIF